ncbi:hypothetical protein GCM10027613_48860 [Microlunatus endophyticus]
MTGTILTLIIAGVIIAVGLVTGLVVGTRRRPLPSQVKPELGEQRSDKVVGGSAVAERETPEGPERGEGLATEVVEPTTPVEAPTEAPAPAIEKPEAPESRLVRLRRRLAGSNNALSRGLLTLLSRDRIDEETWEDFEDTLLTSDLGVKPTMELVEALRDRLRVEGTADPTAARTALREELIKLVDPTLDRSLAIDRTEVPAVVMVVGVNGTGKTTTVGKLARVLVAEDKDVVLGAADTFRAAAADQLETWGSRVGVPTVRGAEGADPASVAFEAVKVGIEGEADVVLIDTAGRLHTKTGLMDELGKIKRVIERQAPVTEVLLLLDATTGQNGLTQARIFAEVVDVTGVVLSKLDGSAKGGIVIQVQRELGVPVKLVGLGEGVDDLAPSSRRNSSTPCSPLTEPSGSQLGRPGIGGCGRLSVARRQRIQAADVEGARFVAHDQLLHEFAGRMVQGDHVVVDRRTQSPRGAQRAEESAVIGPDCGGRRQDEIEVADADDDRGVGRSAGDGADRRHLQHPSVLAAPGDPLTCVRHTGSTQEQRARFPGSGISPAITTVVRAGSPSAR